MLCPDSPDRKGCCGKVLGVLWAESHQLSRACSAVESPTQGCAMSSDWLLCGHKGHLQSSPGLSQAVPGLARPELSLCPSSFLLPSCHRHWFQWNADMFTCPWQQITNSIVKSFKSILLEFREGTDNRVLPLAWGTSVCWHGWVEGGRENGCGRRKVMF